jgi:hypothetical protein
MHYVTRRSHRMEKHKFGVTGPDALFIDTARGPAELEKSWVECDTLCHCSSYSAEQYLTMYFRSLNEILASLTRP